MGIGEILEAMVLAVCDHKSGPAPRPPDDPSRADDESIEGRPRDDDR
jgi:hypothetical protein